MLLTSHRKIRCLSDSRFSHHNGKVLKAAHCVCVTPLTCLVSLDLSHRWQTLWATFYTFVLYLKSNEGAHRQKNDSLKQKSHVSKWHTLVPLLILQGVLFVVCLCSSFTIPPRLFRFSVSQNKKQSTNMTSCHSLSFDLLHEILPVFFIFYFFNILIRSTASISNQGDIKVHFINSINTERHLTLYMTFQH